MDLPGRRLIGALIATLGLPQVNPVNEEIRKLVANRPQNRALPKRFGLVRSSRLATAKTANSSPARM